MRHHAMPRGLGSTLTGKRYKKAFVFPRYQNIVKYFLRTLLYFLHIRVSIRTFMYPQRNHTMCRFICAFKPALTRTQIQTCSRASPCSNPKFKPQWTLIQNIEIEAVDKFGLEEEVVSRHITPMHVADTTTIASTVLLQQTL